MKRRVKEKAGGLLETSLSVVDVVDTHEEGAP